MLSISNLAATSALTAVENKVPSVSNLVKKTDYNTKITEIGKKLTDHNHNEYITTLEFNKLKLAQAELVTKTDFNNKLTSFNRKIVSNKTKNLLTENELKKIKKFDLIYFMGKSYFDEDGSQNYLVFQLILKYYMLNSTQIRKWILKRLSNESLEVVSTSDHTSSPSISYYGDKVRLKFTGSVLQQKRVTYSHKKVVNIYVVYEITNVHGINNYPTLTKALFGAVKLTKNADIDKYKYSGYGNGFDGKGFYSNGNEIGRNVLIFGVNMDSSTNLDNEGKDISILGKGPTQGLGEHSLSGEKMYFINFTKVNTKFCLSLHYNGDDSHSFVNCTEIIKFKAKDSMIIPNNLCLGNISKDLSASSMKKTGFNGYIYDFSVDYDSIDVDGIKNIPKYLMKKNDIV